MTSSPPRDSVLTFPTTLHHEKVLAHLFMHILWSVGLGHTHATATKLNFSITTKDYVMWLTVLKVLSHMILLDPANNPLAQADSVVSSIPQGRSLEKHRPLPKVS